MVHRKRNPKTDFYSTRDYLDVLEGRLFLCDVSPQTAEHVMFTVREKAMRLVQGGRWNSHEFPWYLKKELEACIDNILNDE